MLSDAERFRLLGGRYRMPRCKIGGWLTCRLRGRVRVVAISDGLIQWPMTQQKHGGNKMLILCGYLAMAVKNESTAAIQHWWGIKSNTVWTWRKALGVDQNNKGTRRLRSKWVDGGTGDAARPGREAALRSPEFAAKMSALKQGKPRTPETIEAMRQARIGFTHTEESKRKMSETHRRRADSAECPFTAEEDALLGTKTDAEIAVEIGKSAHAVAKRRNDLGIETFSRRTKWNGKPIRPFTAEEDAQLGIISDSAIPAKFGRTMKALRRRRIELGILPYHRSNNRCL